MIFLAGMGGNDLVEFATWQGEAPTGWVDIDLQGAGGRHEKVGRRGSKSRQRRGSRRKGNLSGEKGEMGARSGAGTGVSVSQGHEAHPDDEILDDGSNGNSSPKTDYEDGDGDGDYHDDDYDDITDMDPSSGNVLKAMVIQVRISENHQNGKDTHVRGFQVFARDDRRLARERHEGARKSLKPHGATGADAATDARNVRAGSSMPVDQGGGAAGDDEVFGPAFDEDDWMGEMEIR